MNKGLFLSLLLFLTVWNCFVEARDPKSPYRRSNRYTDPEEHFQRGTEDLKAASEEGIRAAEEYAEGIKKSFKDSGDYIKSISSKGYNALKHTFDNLRDKAHDAADKVQDYQGKDDPSYLEMLEDKYYQLKQKVDEYSQSIKESLTEERPHGRMPYRRRSSQSELRGKPGLDRLRDVGDRAYQKILKEQEHLKEAFSDGRESTSEMMEDVVEKGKELGEKGKRIGENVLEKAIDYGKVGFGAVKDSVRKTISGFESVQRDAFIREHAHRLLNVIENAEKSVSFARDIAEEFINEVVKKVQNCDKKRNGL